MQPHSHSDVVRLSKNGMPIISCTRFGLFLLLLGVQAAFAQSPCFDKKAGTVACLIPQALNSTFNQLGALVLPDNPTGLAVMVTPLTATQPVPSTASGFLYSTDPSTGVLVRTSSSFGAILTERAETIGRHKVFVGAAVQHFTFDKIDGADPHAVTFAIPAVNGRGLETANVDLQLTQTTLYTTYGLNDRLDLSLAVPISSVYGGVAINGAFLGSGSATQTRSFAIASHRASGLGDINLLLKHTVLRTETLALAVGASVRLPTGDEYEALGAGTAGLKPFIAASFSHRKVSPHVNMAYQLNGKSILSGNIITGVKRHLPDQLQYAVGLDAGVMPRLTLVCDILTTVVIHGDRLAPNAAEGASFYRRSYSMINGAAGFKANLAGNLLLVANALFRLNDAGLRSKVVPLVGLSYVF